MMTKLYPRSWRLLLLPRRLDDRNYNRYWEKIEFELCIVYFGVHGGFANALSTATIDAIFDVCLPRPLFRILRVTVIGHQTHVAEKYQLFLVDNLLNRVHSENLDSILRKTMRTTTFGAEVVVSNVVVVVLKQPQDVDECHGRESHGPHGSDDEEVVYLEFVRHRYYCYDYSSHYILCCLVQELFYGYILLRD
jgi:hypothetical protein